MHTTVKGGGILFLLADLLLYGFKGQRGRKGESLRGLGCFLTSLTHTSTRALLQRQLCSDLWGWGQDRGPLATIATRHHVRVRDKQRHSLFPRAENVTQMDFWPRKAVEIILQ